MFDTRIWTTKCRANKRSRVEETEVSGRTKCSLFSLLHLRVCTASNFFTTILIYNWLFPPIIHCLSNCLPRLFRCALKTSSSHETLRWSENKIIIIILDIQDSPYFLRIFKQVHFGRVKSISVYSAKKEDLMENKVLICVGAGHMQKHNRLRWFAYGSILHFFFLQTCCD